MLSIYVQEDEQAQRQREAERSALKDAATTAKPKDVRLKTVSMEKAVTKTTASRNATPAPAAQDTNQVWLRLQSFITACLWSLIDACAQAADAGAGATPTLSDEVMAPSVPTENAWAHGAPKLGRETREAPPSNHSPSPNPSPSPSPATDAIAAVLESDDEPEDDVTDGAILTQVCVRPML
jgi:hypothetical protein